MSVDLGLLSRIESAGLNASAPPQQRWLDGWLLRCLAGKARRARCINALASGHLPLDDKLARADRVYQDAGVPTIFRITRFTATDTPEAMLRAHGFVAVDPTDIMACTSLPHPGRLAAWPAGWAWDSVDAASFAETVGELRNTPPQQRQTHALRLRAAPVPHHAAVVRDGHGEVLACGQFAREGELVGLYDVFVEPRARGRGLARLLCERLLAVAASEGATVGYLQVERANAPAQRVYRSLGFSVVDGYHYLQRPESQPAP